MPEPASGHYSLIQVELFCVYRYTYFNKGVSTIPLSLSFSLKKQLLLSSSNVVTKQHQNKKKTIWATLRLSAKKAVLEM